MNNSTRHNQKPGDCQCRGQHRETSCEAATSSAEPRPSAGSDFQNASRQSPPPLDRTGEEVLRDIEAREPRENPFNTVPLTGNPIVKTNAAHVRRLMKEAGFTLKQTPKEVMQAAAAREDECRSELLRRVRDFFSSEAVFVPQGLEGLPSCWLAGLPGILWRTRKPHWTHLPYFINRLEEQEGVLVLHFAQEQPEVVMRITAWDRVRLAVNASLYPNCWREISKWQKRSGR